VKSRRWCLVASEQINFWLTSRATRKALISSLCTIPSHLYRCSRPTVPTAIHQKKEKSLRQWLSSVGCIRLRLTCPPQISPPHQTHGRLDKLRLGRKTPSFESGPPDSPDLQTPRRSRIAHFYISHPRLFSRSATDTRVWQLSSVAFCGRSPCCI
jgi:hypothetical protein